MRPVAEASQLSKLQFVEQFGGVYEHSPWVAEAAWEEGLATADETPAALAVRMAAIVEASGRARQLALLRLHPELVGKLSVGHELTPSSMSEQASARLDQCTPAEFARFQDLNARYRERFGFPFIIAVRGLTRGAILEAFARRVDNPPEVEFRAALDQVHRIARLRLGLMLGGEQPGG